MHTHRSVILHNNNMDGALKSLMLAALILLVTARINYRSLPDFYREHIDKALKNANSNFGAGHHIAFHSIRGEPKFKDSTVNVNVLLMVTTCKKNSSDAYGHRDECDKRQQKTPMIHCLVCKTKDDQELVDCAKWADVRDKKRDTIRGKCKKEYLHGVSTAL